MQPVTFTEQEVRLLLNAVDQFVRQNGLANAGLALAIAAKLQATTKAAPVIPKKGANGTAKARRGKASATDAASEA